jgi:hypothetical protein
MARYERTIKDGAARLLEEGEDGVAALIAGRAATPSTSRDRFGSARRSAHTRTVPAELVDLRLEASMAVALTQRRLLTLKIGTPIGLGIGGNVKELMPIGDVDSIGVKRLALGYTITLTVRGVAITLEANAASGTKRFADAFDRTRTVTG